MFNDYYVFKSLAPGRCGNDVKSLMFKLIIQNNNLDPGTHREITFRWIPRNLIDQSQRWIRSWCTSQKILPEPM